MRILLVEDDEALAQAVGSYLRSKAFLIDSVPSLAQARACLAGASYAAVLLDLHLSDGDGLALMPTLRRLEQPPVTIVLTVHPGRLYTREHLLDALYGFDAEADSNTLEVFISRLRRKLGRERILTVRGTGYRLVTEHG